MMWLADEHVPTRLDSHDLGGRPGCRTPVLGGQPDEYLVASGVAGDSVWLVAELA